MLKHQQQELDDFEKRRDGLELTIKNKTKTLHGVNTDIEKAEDKLRSQERHFAVKTQQLEKNYEKLKSELSQDLLAAQTEVDDLNKVKGDLDRVIGEKHEAITGLERMRTELEDSNQTRRAELDKELLDITADIEAVQKKMPALIAAQEKAQKRLDFVTQQIVDGEAAYDKRSAELNAQVGDLRKSVQKLTEQAREYEMGMRYTREEDKKRAKELDDHEANLKGRERRLGQEIADFEKRKQRFNQLKDLQS